MYSVTPWCVRITTVAMETQNSFCVYCSATYFSSSSSVGPMVNATDVLQSKRLIVLTLFLPHVWTFPRSPTDAPMSPHDARDPSSERWNYVGEN